MFSAWLVVQESGYYNRALVKMAVLFWCFFGVKISYSPRKWSLGRTLVVFDTSSSVKSRSTSHSTLICEMSSFLDKMQILSSRATPSFCPLPVLLLIVPRMPTGFSLLPKDYSRAPTTSWSAELEVRGTNGSSCPTSPRSGCQFL